MLHLVKAFEECHQEVFKEKTRQWKRNLTHLLVNVGQLALPPFGLCCASPQCPAFFFKSSSNIYLTWNGPRAALWGDREFAPLIHIRGRLHFHSSPNQSDKPEFYWTGLLWMHPECQAVLGQCLHEALVASHTMHKNGQLLYAEAWNVVIISCDWLAAAQTGLGLFSPSWARVKLKQQICMFIFIIWFLFVLCLM